VAMATDTGAIREVWKLQSAAGALRNDWRPII